MPSWSELLTEINASAAANNGRPDFDAIRRGYLADLFSHTGRNVILYATRFTSQDAPPALLSIVDDDMTGLMTVIHGLKGRKLDLILHSPGGSLEAAESFMEYLRSKFTSIRVIVPQLALSAATIMACGADTVLMGKHSFLGPIDPQILINTRWAGASYVPAQAILEQFDKAVRECQDPKRLAAWVPMLEQYGPHLLVFCENATALSRTVVAKWLKKWMFKGDPDRSQKANKIADWLSDHREFRSHGRHIPRWELRKKGFRAEPLEQDKKLQDLVLSVFHMCTHTFGGTGAAKIIENHAGKAFIRSFQAQQMIPMPMQMPIPSPKQPSP